MGEPTVVLARSGSALPAWGVPTVALARSALPTFVGRVAQTVPHVAGSFHQLCLLLPLITIVLQVLLCTLHLCNVLRLKGPCLGAMAQACVQGLLEKKCPLCACKGGISRMAILAHSWGAAI